MEAERYCLDCFSIMLETNLTLLTNSPFVIFEASLTPSLIKAILDGASLFSDGKIVGGNSPVCAEVVLENLFKITGMSEMKERATRKNMVLG